MKDPVQKKESASTSNEGVQEKQSGGATMSPPAFALASGPIQKKENDTKGEKKPLNKQQAYITKYAASAIALERKDGIPALFTLAQGALESAWGEKAIGNALFGIKAGSKWKGKKQLATTTEYFDTDTHRDDFPEVISVTKTPKGNYKYIVKDWFRDYDTVEEGLKDHSAFLITNKRYAAAFNTTTPDEFAHAVAAAGYATADGYGDTLVTMIRSVKKHWPEEAGSIPAGNSRAITGGKPGGVNPDPQKPATETSKPTKEPAKPATAGGTAPAKGNSISGSVGEGGANKQADALLVKSLLIKAGYALSGSADVGPKTIGYIKDYQTKALGWKNPDGLVEPNGATFKALLRGQGLKPASGQTSAKPSAPSTGLNYDVLSERLYNAMFGGITGFGTDEDAIYATLGMLERDGDRIQKLKTNYARKYKRDLVSDLRSELSNNVIFGNQLTKAIEMLTPKASSQPQTGTKTPAAPVKGANEVKPGTQTAGSVGARLDKFYNDFSHIQVTHGDKTISVTPPYHINRGDRMDNALAARKASPKVTDMLSDLISAGKVAANAKLGKSQPKDLKAILEEAVSRGLVKHDAGDMHNFLSKYGLSVDCSGYVSQALNFLMDGNQVVDRKDHLQPGNYGSGSLKGGTENFTKVDIADVQAGDTMHLEGHIRIINEVVKVGKVVYFRTAESTAAKNGETGMNGIMTRWWKYEGGKKYNTWKSQNGPHPAADDKGWKLSSEKNTFGRYKKLEK